MGVEIRPMGINCNMVTMYTYVEPVQTVENTHYSSKNNIETKEVDVNDTGTETTR